MNKYFKNVTPTSADYYIYGTIEDEKWDENSVVANEMKQELDELGNIRDLNIYINSPGGSVFASSTIVSLLKRFKEKTNCKIHSYIDGLCASAATYLCMIADDINIYQNSIMMIHKPMSCVIGNSNDMQKEIDTLNTIENDLMLPMYMKKALKSEDEIKQLVNDETWFNGNENDDLYVGNYFDVNLIDEEKQAVACVSEDLFRNYKHIPSNLRNLLDQKEKPKQEEQPKQIENNQEEKEEEKIDYSEYEKTISLLKEEK